jgi:hypothetical protein
MTLKSTLIGSALDHIYSFNLKQRTLYKDGKTNTPHKDGTTKYTVLKREIKTNNYVKITLIYYNEKEKQFRGMILG